MDAPNLPRRLPPGSRIGPYEIETAIGAGGMGEVYRARDLKLGRAVAIKILPEAIAQDPDRLARFDREARVLAALNHPHIATIFGVEEDVTRSAPTDVVGALGEALPRPRALVMELVEGETLADLIAAGPVPLEVALPAARQIAEALEAAHEQNIVHRDLKPANIKLTPAGQVKVLDFGLAKALPPEPDGGVLSFSPTRSVAATMQGVVLGTAAYMSPEQARGRPVDRSSDLWAFGCVLFEMLSGRPAFQGEDVTEIAAAILKNDPDWAALPASTPAIIRVLLRQCLQKQPEQRLRDARSARLTIDAAMSDETAAMRPAASPSGGSRWRLLLPGAAVAAGVLAVWAAFASRPQEPLAHRLQLPVTPAERLVGSAVSSRPSRPAFAISPDGRTVVFTGVQGPATRPVAVLPDVMQAIDSYSVPDETHSGQFAVSDNGTFMYLQGGTYPPRQLDLVWVDRNGRQTRLPVEPRDYLGPRVSPNGTRIAYAQRSGRNGDIWISDLIGDRPRRLTFGGGNFWPTWSPDSLDLTFQRRVSAGFELARMAATGTGSSGAVAAEIQQAPASWCKDVLAVLRIRESVPTQIWTLRPDGTGEAERWLDSPVALSHPAFSPDCRWIAYVSAESGREEVYVAPYPGPGERIRISTLGGHSPVWSRTRWELFYMRASGDEQEVLATDIDSATGSRRGESRRLFEGPYRATTPLAGYDIAPDDRFIMARSVGAAEPPVTHINVWLNWVEELKRVLPAP